jgi:hypothetical protein
VLEATLGQVPVSRLTITRLLYAQGQKQSMHGARLHIASLCFSPAASR